MIRTPVVLVAAVVLALGAPAAGAGASPNPVPSNPVPSNPVPSNPVPSNPVPNPEPCAYTLSPPHIVQLSGTDAVSATLSPAGCDSATAYLSVACLQLQGSDGPGQCGQNNGILTAQVWYQPYRPGATYIATGRGCANTGNPPQPVCRSVGPLTATL